MKHHGRLTFGVLIGLVNSGYYKDILSGILDFAGEHDLNLHCFASGLLTSPSRWGSDDDLLFTMLDRADLDGLIVLSTALEYYVGRDAFSGFLSRYRSIPLASIGKEIPGIPSFVIDNEKGMRGLLEHLTDDHGYQRLAYVSGPLRNSEAAIRLATYRDFLCRRGIAYDPSLVVEGDFTGRSGKEAVRSLLRERSREVDVVIAANDLMAFGAIEELRSWGVAVPGGMRVVGFDDIDTCGDANLTTVRQPLFLQGYEAASALHRLCRGEACRPLTLMPTETVIRESCGCPSAALAACAIPFPPSAVGPHDGGDAGPPDGEDAGVRDLRAALHASLDTRDPEKFLVAWREYLFAGGRRGDLPPSLQYLLSLLRNEALGRPHSPEEGTFAESLFHRGRILIDEEIRREIATQNVAAEIQEQHLAFIDSSLTGVGSLDEQLHIIYSEFPALGIRSCYLSLFEDAAVSPARARLILAYEDCRRIELPLRGVAFPASELIPAAFFPDGRRHNFVVKILAHRGANLGYILMELGDDVRFARIYDFLCPKLSAVLQLTMFIDKTVKQARDLDRANRHLEESNRALEEFAFMASHDLQEPLRKILMFGDRLSESGRDVLDDRARDYLARMRRSAGRLRNMIESLLDYSRVATTDKPFVDADLGRIVGVVLGDLQERIERSGAAVSVAPLPVVKADPAQMHRLFSNLIENALKFQPPGARPVVDISVLSTAEEGIPAIVVADNGIGIDVRDHEKVFVVFQRLHARRDYEGNGIGLAVCKRIMERHGGTITVERAPGCGTRFILWFGPRVAPGAYL